VLDRESLISPSFIAKKIAIPVTELGEIAIRVQGGQAEISGKSVRIWAQN
jgi:hypothetical protein